MMLDGANNGEESESHAIDYELLKLLRPLLHPSLEHSTIELI